MFGFLYCRSDVFVFWEKVVLMCCKGFEPERDEPVKKTCRWHVFRARGRSGYAATIFCTGKTLQRAAVSTEPVPQERWDIQFFVIHECYNKVITMK